MTPTQRAPVNLFIARGRERSQRIERERQRIKREQLAEARQAKRVITLAAANA